MSKSTFKKTAWIERSDGILAAHENPSSPLAQIGYGPLVSLVRFVYKKYESQARSILRIPIQMNYPIGPVEWAVMKVCAKRCRFVESMPSYEPSSEVAEGERISETLLEKAITSEAAMLLAKQTIDQSRGSKKVSTVILGPDFQLISIGIHIDSCQHAEMMAVESYVVRNQKKIPQGSKVFSTLKPCKMCAAVLMASCEVPSSLEVLYLNDDPGPMARNTSLEARTFSREMFFKRESPEYTKSQVYRYLDLR